MKSKEYMIETMAKAIYKIDHQLMKERNAPNNAWVDSYSFDDENHESLREELRQKAEAALKALCGALPDVPEVTFNVDGHKHTNIDVYELEDIYNQLKQWGK